MSKLNVEVCYAPSVFDLFKKKQSNVVVVDVLRATSAICNAFNNGAAKIIPVGTLDEAREYKEKNYLIAAERDAVVQDFADFGNSPFNFSKDKVEGKEIVYSTTNGTNAIQMAAECNKVIIGSFINITAVAEWLKKQNEDVIVLCAGWKGKFSLEDSVFAGALVEMLLQDDRFETICDSALATIDLWDAAKNDLVQYIDKAANRHRLKRLGLDDVIEFCHTLDQNAVLPIYKDGIIVDVSNSES